MHLVAAILSGFLLAPFALAVSRASARHAGWILALLPAALTLYFALQLPAIAAGETIRAGLTWAPRLGIELSFRMDGLAAAFALLITGIGALVLGYTGRYLEDPVRRGRCLAYLLAFMASMLGLVLADNLIALFVFWELTSVASFLLIGLEHGRAGARRAAWRALMVTVAGGQALLVGVVLLGLAGGGFELSLLLERGDAVRGHALYPAILALVLLAAFTKSAQVPFHFWLPEAMEAPSPVSAYLHSATMVKAGVYLLARLAPVLGGTPAWTLALTAVGAATMAVGAALALGQSDLKRVLAYSTVSALGTLVLLVGVGTVAAFTAAAVFLLVHALYKGALFLVAGVVEHETGTRDAERLGGLRRALPVTAAAALLAAFSMAGLPLLFGFIGKELVYHATVESPVAAAPLTLVALAAFALTVAAAALAGLRPFLGPRAPTPRPPREPPASLWIGSAALALAGLVVGLMPGLIESALVAPAVAAMAAVPLDVELRVWPGFRPELALSASSVVLGVVAYLGRDTIRRGLRSLRAERWGPARGYGALEAGMLAGAGFQTRVLQSGYLRHYLATTFAATAALVGWTLVARGGLPPAIGTTDLLPYEAGIAVLVLLACLLVGTSTGLIRAVIALGVVGFGVALVFVLFGAPDLAMTQFLVETLTVVLFVVVFYSRPRVAPTLGNAGRVRDAVIAGAVGFVVASLLLAATRVQLAPTISGEYAARSVPEAHGRNIVNIILVDFRALDTLGEAVVLGLAALGVFTLLRLGAPPVRRARAPRDRAPEPRRVPGAERVPEAGPAPEPGRAAPPYPPRGPERRRGWRRREEAP